MPRGYKVAIALSVTVLTLSLLYVSLLAREHRKLSGELTRIQVDLQQLQRDIATHDLITASRVDYLEKVLFGEVVAKLDDQAKRPTAGARLASWQKNLDKELRDRISSLERRLFKMETTVDEKLK